MCTMDPVNDFEVLFKQNFAGSWTPSVPLGHEGCCCSWVFLKGHTFSLERGLGFLVNRKG